MGEGYALFFKSLSEQIAVFHRNRLVRRSLPQKTGRRIFGHLCFQRHVFKFRLRGIRAQQRLDGALVRLSPEVITG